VRIVDSLTQVRPKPAAATPSDRSPQFTPAPASDQLGPLSQSSPPDADADPARFKQIILPQLDAAYNYARYLSRDADAAQDIVQDAFLRAYRSFSGYRGGDARAWILTIVRNCYYGRMMNLQRKLRVEIGHNGDTDEIISAMPSDQDTPETALVRKARTETVRRMLDAMPRPMREILILREFEDLSYHQISKVTALPVGTVMSRLARARRAFKDAWSRAADGK
jgi:RNA polymerase sigma factor (sigma-70 family)